MALERGAALQVRDSRELADRVALLLDQPGLRRAATTAAGTMLAENRGALARTIELLGSHSLAGLTADTGCERAPVR
jgi:3-deoxy-D-manno-octulosonic-acid transferase